MSGNVPTGCPLTELNVMSVVTAELPSGAIVLGEADPRSTIQGLKFTPGPTTTPQPALFGPALQPHQLFSIPAFNVPVKPAPQAWVTAELVLLMMRFRPATTSRVKPVSASR